MAHLLMILMTSPYTYENSHTVIKLADAALDKNHQVSIHFYVDGVINGSKLIATDDNRIPLLHKEFERLAQRGAAVTYCPTCAIVRGLKNHMIDSAKEAGVGAFGQKIQEVDKILTFGVV